MARFGGAERAVGVVPPAMRVLVRNFRRHLLAENKAPRTVQIYREPLRRAGEFLVRQGRPTDPTVAAREHLEALIAEHLTKHRPAMAAYRYR